MCSCMGFIELIDNMTCFARKSDHTELVELCQWDFYVDVSQTEPSLMQMKTIDYMREVNT